MSGELPIDPNQVALEQLNDRLTRIEQLEPRDIAWFNWQNDLEKIGTLARQAGESPTHRLRASLKKVLLHSIALSRNSQYINEHLTDLAYSPEELEQFKIENEKSQRKKEVIEAEIKSGKDTWLAHIDQNQRNLTNPYITGFYQDHEGKIRTIYGPRHFKSKRQIENSFLGGRNENKEVNLILGEFRPVHPTKILRSEHWDSLPDELRRHFERGEILVTGNEDLYNLSESNIEDLADSQDPNALLNVLDSKISNISNGDKKYLLHYYSDFGGDETGRTGVVLQSEAGSVSPVIVKIGNKEFVIEVKGCGKKSGGFGQMHFRTGRDIITGGAEAQQAETEFFRLKDDPRPDAPKAIGALLFSNPQHRDYDGADYQQGYVIRLTPSTVRTAYTGIEVYPDIENPKMVAKVLDMYTSQLINHIFSDPPKILDRSSHSENILVWSNGEFAWTDYSDHVAFADRNFPHDENHGGYMTPKKMLEYYLRMVDEIPGYKAGRDKRKFHSNLTKYFQAQGLNLQLESDDDNETITQKIWESGMAYRVFVGRKAENYVAEGVLHEFQKAISTGFLIRELDMDSEETFVAREIVAREAMLNGVALAKERLKDKVLPEVFDQWQQILKVGPLSQVLKVYDEFNHLCFYQYDAFNEEEKDIIYNSKEYYSNFSYVLVSHFQEYFEHELDVIACAKLSNQNNSIEELNRSEEEIKDKMEGFFDLMDTDLAGFYRFINDPEQVRKYVSCSFYGN